MMLALMTVAGVMAGAGVVLIVRGAMSPPAALEEIVADLHRPRMVAPAPHGVRAQIDAAVSRFALWGLSERQPDLRVLERSADKFTQDRILWSVIGASLGLFALATQPLGLVSWMTLPIGLGLCVLGAVSGWFYALVDLRSDAVTARAEFVAAVASYLELVSILMAGGAGVQTALFEAAQVGRGRGYRHLRAALTAAQAHREEPWARFGELGRLVGVTDLEALAASMTLAGDGAQVRDALRIKAETVRERALAEQEAAAHSRSETMVLPVAMMFAGFLLLIGYPALAGLSGP